MNLKFPVLVKDSRIVQCNDMTYGHIFILEVGTGQGVMIQVLVHQQLAVATPYRRLQIALVTAEGWNGCFDPFLLQSVFFICIMKPPKKLDRFFFLQFYPLKELSFFRGSLTSRSSELRLCWQNSEIGPQRPNLVLGKFGPGQSGPRQLGPGARLSGAQLSAPKKWQIGPRTVGPQKYTIRKIKESSKNITQH